jgi:7,8-dihydroneopterin aldolase/epimerase/oxygenase
VLFGHRFGAAVLALMRHARIVTHAIQADFQVRGATVARLASPWLAAQGEFPAAFVAMSGHSEILTSGWLGEKFGLCSAPGPFYLVPVDTIVIKDLGVLCHVGVPDEERAKPQRLLITVEMGGDLSRAGATDDIQHTINYFDVSRRVIALCQEQSYRLLEKLAEDIARAVLNEYGAKNATVEVKKFILSDARYVSVRIQRSR